jgi:drug/metabolite transporter (DMT)-like permease
VLAAAAGLPFLFADLAARAPDLASPAGLAAPLAGLIAGVLYLGLLQQGLSLAFYSRGISRVPALPAILVMTLEPILNPVWVALGTGELPGGFALAGGLVVLSAVTARGLLAVRAEARARRVAG